MVFNEADFIALSAIQHYFFCSRQFALIHVEKQWKENTLTAEGRVLHERVDNSKYIERRPGYIVERSVAMRSAELGVYGVADVVEFSSSDNGVQLPDEQGLWQPRPVEYKRGHAKTGICDKAQLCCQAICLEEMYGISIESGDLFYWQTRRRLPIVFDRTLRTQVAKACTEMHTLIREGLTPAVPEKASCKNCSMKDICLPKIGKRKKGGIENYIQENTRRESDAKAA